MGINQIKQILIDALRAHLNAEKFMPSYVDCIVDAFARLDEHEKNMAEIYKEK